MLKHGLLAVALCAPAVALAGEARVVDATATWLDDERARVSVTIAHADEGWDHYADRWDVLDGNGRELGSRTLYHPHVEEQPFTRSLTLTIPDGVAEVFIQAHDSVHGLNPERFALTLPPR